MRRLAAGIDPVPVRSACGDKRRLSEAGESTEQRQYAQLWGALEIYSGSLRETPCGARQASLQASETSRLRLLPSFLFNILHGECSLITVDNRFGIAMIKGLIDGI